MNEFAVKYLKRDFELALKAIGDKPLEEINLETLEEYLKMVVGDVQRLRQGIVARDGFVSSTIQDEEATHLFDRQGPVR